MKKTIFWILIFILLLLLFDLYNPFNIKLFNINDNSTKKNIVAENNKPVQKRPITAKDYFVQGKTDLRNNNIKMAILNFSKAIELNPDYAEAYKERALANDKKGNFTESKEDYERYMALLNEQNKEENEKIKNEINNLVDQIRKKIVNKKYDEAIEDSTNIIESYPKHPNGYIIRADTYFSMQKYKQALDDYKKAISLSLGSKNFNLYLKLANAEYESGLYNDSIKDYLQIINLNQNYEYAYYKLIGAYIFVEDFNNALSILRKYKTISKTKRIQVTDYTKWTTILNKYTEDETIRDLKKELKELNFIQS